MSSNFDMIWGHYCAHSPQCLVKAVDEERQEVLLVVFTQFVTVNLMTGSAVHSNSLWLCVTLADGDAVELMCVCVYTPVWRAGGEWNHEAVYQTQRKWVLLNEDVSHHHILLLGTRFRWDSVNTMYSKQPMQVRFFFFVRVRIGLFVVCGGFKHCSLSAQFFFYLREMLAATTKDFLVFNSSLIKCPLWCNLTHMLLLLHMLTNGNQIYVIRWNPSKKLQFALSMPPNHNHLL